MIDDSLTYVAYAVNGTLEIERWDWKEVRIDYTIDDIDGFLDACYELDTDGYHYIINYQKRFIRDESGGCITCRFEGAWINRVLRQMDLMKYQRMFNE